MKKAADSSNDTRTTTIYIQPPRTAWQIFRDHERETIRDEIRQIKEKRKHTATPGELSTLSEEDENPLSMFAKLLARRWSLADKAFWEAEAVKEFLGDSSTDPSDPEIIR